MDEHVACAHRGEHVGLFIAVAGPRSKRRVRDRCPSRLAQLGVTFDPSQLPEVAEIEQPFDVVDLDLVDPEPVDQPAAQGRIHPRADFEAHDFAKAPAPQLILDRLQQVIGLIGYLEVRVPGDAEQVVADDLHPGEQLVEVCGDHILERDEHVLG